MKRIILLFFGILCIALRTILATAACSIEYQANEEPTTQNFSVISA